uniref:Protein kinase domain-containing protein n=1 Tax=Zooxanthella nutricula TaxID=1333877 RepID=A0A7S2JVP9_9DINO
MKVLTGVRYGGYSKPRGLGEMVDLFHKEIKMHIVLGKHPNILSLYDWGFMDWPAGLGLGRKPYMLLEMAYGGTLFHAIQMHSQRVQCAPPPKDTRKKKPPAWWSKLFGLCTVRIRKEDERKPATAPPPKLPALSLDAKITIMVLVNALRGLTHLHKQGIIHRDVKPENLFIASKDTDCIKTLSCRYMIGDLGLSVRADSSGKAWGGAGTPAYTPPESRSGGCWSYLGDV